MASNQASRPLEESDGGSIETISSSGSSSELRPDDQNDDFGLSVSCPAVLEPSKDESRGSDGRPKNTLQFLTRSCPQPSTQEDPISSGSESHSHEDEQLESSESHRAEDEQPRIGEDRNANQQQTDEPRTTCCCPISLDSYRNYAHRIGSSYFIHVFQLLIGMIFASAIVMGIIYFGSCEVGVFPAIHPVLAIMLGISGLILIYMWLVKVCRQRRGEYYWNQDKNNLILCLSAVLITATVEFILFNQMSPKPLQTLQPAPEEDKTKCPKTFYDYLYYMHITNVVVLVAASLLYLPDCYIHVDAYRPVEQSQANGHYQPL